MFKNEISTYTQAIQLKCIELRTESERLQYGRFAVSPFDKGQASTVGIAMRRALLQEIKGTSITFAKFNDIVHEYSTITGLQETIHDVLVNPKEIVFKSESNEILKASLSVTGPKEITAGDILLPSGIKLIDKSQYIATITQPISPTIQLEIERDRGYRIGNIMKQDGRFPIDAVFMPVLNVNYSIHLFGNTTVMQEILFIEIWTNGSPTPHEALIQASHKLMDLLTPFLQLKSGTSIEIGKKPIYSTRSLSSQLNITDANKQNKPFPNDLFIDQLELPARTFNCLKRAEIYTIGDLLTYSREDLLRIRNFGQKSADQVVKQLWQLFNIKLPN
uniref:DNA-directed RNA polymerase subunit alpha n=1 Tax=Vaginularia trichoidea TaxID=474354 RepID=A0A3G5CTB5_9MONI|nr:RNA polymerase alpha subunit [Vaginularia trichoidea]AYW16105.1 RNA polymerase alpha subunit [Vaginularia trichoidea]